MKKLISLSAAFLITAIAMAQDTIPKMQKENIPGGKTMDTMPKSSNWNKDTSLMNRVNKRPDSSMQKTIPDSANGQSNTGSQPDSTAMNNTAKADRVIMKDGQVMVVKGGDSTLLKDSIKLESGAIVMKDGNVTYTSGKTVLLKNGQYVSLSPTENTSQADSSSTEKTKMDATATASTATTSTTTSTTTTTSASTDTTAKTKPVIEDKVVMKDNKVFVIQKGDSTLLEDSIRLKSGAVVKSDASVKFKDGSKTTLKNGQYIALNPEPADNKKTKKAAPKKANKKKG